MRRAFIDVIVRHKMSQQGMTADAAWIDDEGLIDLSKIEGDWYHYGPICQMFENAGPVADALMAVVERKVASHPGSTPRPAPPAV